MPPQEANKTQKARKKIIEMYRDQGFEVTEEEVFPCFNNMGEAIYPPYQADIVVRKTFIIELDPLFHGSKIQRNKDEWRDRNIEREHNIKTARVDPDDVMKQDLIDIMLEVDHQLIRPTSIKNEQKGG